jgi:predicted peroxiredoxin
MRTLIFSILLPALMLISCQSKENPSSGEKAATMGTAAPRDGMFIHLSKGPEDAHRVLMAFKMAEVMSADKDVLMYLDIEAVHLVVKDAPDVSKEGFPSTLEQISKLLEAGVIIQVCPTCLKVAGYTESDLMEGVSLANKEKFFNFTQGKTLSIDY